MTLKLIIALPEYDLRGRRSTITRLPVRSYSGIDTFFQPCRQCAGDATANVSRIKTFFLVNSVNTNTVLNAHVHV